MKNQDFLFFFSKEMFETESRVIKEPALFAPRANIRYQERRITLCGRSVVTDAYFARNHSCRLSDHCDVFSTYPPAQSRLLPWTVIRMSERWKISLCCRSSSFPKKKKKEKGAIRKFLGYFVQKYSKKKKEGRRKNKRKKTTREREKKRNERTHLVPETFSKAEDKKILLAHIF